MKLVQVGSDCWVNPEKVMSVTWDTEFGGRMPVITLDGDVEIWTDHYAVTEEVTIETKQQQIIALVQELRKD